MRTRAPRRGIVSAIVVVALALGAAAHARSASASTIESQEKYVLAAGETVEGNLYAFGESVTIDGTVDGDLAAAGRSIIIGPAGVVTGDLLAAGQEIRVEGTVEGDIRAAGMAVQVVSGGSVGGEMLGTGYSVGVSDHAKVGDDFTAAGYQGIVDGEVGGNVDFAGAGLGINGLVGGDVSAEVGDASAANANPMQVMSNFMEMPRLIRQVAPGLQLGQAAQIKGNLAYTAREEVTPPESAVAGEVTQTPVVEEESEPAPNPAVSYGRSALGLFIGLLVAGFLVLLVGGRLVERAYDVMAARPLPSAGWGCLSLILIPILLVAVAAVTLGGLLIFGVVSLGSLKLPIVSAGVLAGTALTFGVVLISWLGWVIVALWVGRKLVNLVSPENANKRALPFAVGALVLALVVALPYLGGFFGVLTAALGIGALVLLAQGRWPLGSPVTAPPANAL